MDAAQNRHMPLSFRRLSGVYRPSVKHARVRIVKASGRGGLSTLFKKPPSSPPNLTAPLLSCSRSMLNVTRSYPAVALTTTISLPSFACFVYRVQRQYLGPVIPLRSTMEEGYHISTGSRRRAARFTYLSLSRSRFWLRTHKPLHRRGYPCGR